MSEFHIIDVSKWQGDIDWERVRASGIDGAMLRAGYGAGNIDQKFVRNAKECTRLGIPFGVYWFSYAWTPMQAEDEAKYCMGAIAPYRITLPVAFDWEYDSYNRAVRAGVTPSRALAVSMAKRFLSVVEQAGYVPMLYTNLDYQNQFFPPEELAGYDRWIAAYRAERPDTPLAMWQYTSRGSVDGIDGLVDCNRLYIDYPAIAAEREKTPDYAALVCEALGLAGETRQYLDGYRYAADLWRKIWEGLAK